MFNLAIDSKLRACDLTRLRVSDICRGSRVATRATVGQEPPFARSRTRTFVRPLPLESGPLPVCGERGGGHNSPGRESRLPRLPVHGVIYHRSAGCVALRAARTPRSGRSHSQRTTAQRSSMLC